MTEIVEFLLARIAEDEAAAERLNRFRLEHPEVHERWTVRRDEDRLVVESSPGGLIRKDFVLDVHYLANDHLVDHIARWDPARVLAECEKNRRIVGLWNLSMSEPAPDFPSVPLGGEAAEVYFDALCLLALPYADHPDFREEWRLDTPEPPSAEDAR